MVNKYMDMKDADHHGGTLVAYTPEKGWSENFMSIFCSQLVGRYQGVDGYSGRIGSILLEY